jgi:membrane fusion protein (multidrug efflux system)
VKTVVWIIVVCIALAVGFWLGREHGGEHGKSDEESSSSSSSATTQESAEDKPVATVMTTPLKRATITETITAFGSVAAPPGNALSVPFEVRVVQVLVAPGQSVSAGTEVVRLEPSPETVTAVTEAKSVVAAAERDLAQTRQRFNDRLATNVELSQSEQALASAKLRLDSLSSRGADKPSTLKANADGIVSKVDVQEGQIVAAGAALVEIAAGKGIEVALGVEPADVTTLKPGQAVELKLVGATDDAQSVAGTIHLIGQRVDPATRLASVFVTLPADAHWMLDAYVVGKIVKASAEALVVPRDAVLDEEDGGGGGSGSGGHVLYTVTAGHAKKHDVRVGLENDRQVQLIADDLKEGDLVISSGNYELEDGMEVNATPAPATTQTTSAPASAEEGK